MDEAKNLPETRDFQASGDGSPPSFLLGDPLKIGRYRIVRRLGQGGFGRVYLAHDDDLDRPVAIKVPNPERVASPADVAAYLAEARVLARLDHPHIVPVYDVGRTEDGLCYTVSKCIEGTDLADRLRQGRPSFRESAELVATVAEALHHAHIRGLVHRDIKPANILLDTQGQPWVADFGLALRDEDYGKEAQVAGTPAYMSPEQARGEGHRVDGRSDIFSLGVVLYELLSGRRPFRGDSHAQVLQQVVAAEPRPPRQVDDTIPKELERIVLKTLSKRATERYTTARDLAEDLRHFLQTETVAGSSATAPGPVTPAPGSTQEATPAPPTPARSDSEQQPVKIIPKGLRSFDRHDAHFFLELLPGPRDRDGLPESLRFWKTRIEATDPDATFKLGLIYGPSGCGKSSLVKAGLLPRLAKHVLPVYVEATAEETEARLRKAMRKACPELGAGLGLVGSVAALRRERVLHPGEKVLVILDQFEQWLFARRGEQDTELVAALRQCDGERVQAIVLVRDDFWLAASRFMRDLEIDLEPNANIALVDLFDLQHARKVLTAFGRAYGKLPDRDRDQTREQDSFLNQAVTGLAQDGRIISVRLALFAEMAKGKPWTPATLREVGGTEGVGLTFLEETFSSPQANPRHRLHQKAAQSVLKALLPQTGTDIKGQMRSAAELRAASGYADRPRDFDDLVHILDPELRLITPTDPEGAARDEGGGASEAAAASSSRALDISPLAPRYYQLTHDYLVHSLRDWLTRKQRETRRGRAELRLADRAALWSARPENRRLPSVLEWANIRLLTRKREWTEPQRRMMRRAAHVHGLRGLGLAILIALVTWGGIEGFGHLRAAALVEFLRVSPTSDVPALVEKLSSHRRWATPRLERLLAETPADSREHLHASLALLEVDPSQVDFLFRRLLGAAPTELPVLREALRPHRSRLTPRLWSELDAAAPGDDRILRSAGALALYDPENPRWADLGGKVAQALVTVNSLDVRPRLEALRPVRARLTAPLAEIFRAKHPPESEHTQATSILTDYASDDPSLVADLLMDADPKAYAAFFPIAQREAAKAVPLFQAEITNGSTQGDEGVDSEQVRDRLAERRARAAVCLVRLGRAEAVWPLLRHSRDPRLRSYLINWLSPLGADPRTLAAELDRIALVPKPTPIRGQQAMDAVLFHPETSMRRALILALGQYDREALSAGEREPLIAKLLVLYENDPDAGIHGAAEWTLQKWGQQEKLNEIDTKLMKAEDRGERRWYVNRQGQAFVLIEGPVEFDMGSPPTEWDRSTLHRRMIPRRFAIASKEVTIEQYRRFVRENPQFSLDWNTLKRYSPEPNGPIMEVSWYGAVAYCNWLSHREGLSKDQWCYLPNERAEYAEGMTIPADVHQRTGYRLPTDGEWEYACRAGTMTGRYYGVSTELLGSYAWYIANCREHAWPCGVLLPNDLGLFDMLGNVLEWCHGTYQAYQPGAATTIKEILNNNERIDEKPPRLLRGGSFDTRPGLVRSAFRFWYAPSGRDFNNGFRPARTYP